MFGLLCLFLLSVDGIVDRIVDGIPFGISAGIVCLEVPLIRMHPSH